LLSHRYPSLGLLLTSTHLFSPSMSLAKCRWIVRVVPRCCGAMWAKSEGHILSAHAPPFPIQSRDQPLSCKSSTRSRSAGAQGRDRVKMARAGSADPPSQPEETKRRIEEQCSNASCKRKTLGGTRTGLQVPCNEWNNSGRVKKTRESREQSCR
jgi:hypothetical protein